MFDNAENTYWNESEFGYYLLHETLKYISRVWLTDERLKYLL